MASLAFLYLILIIYSIVLRLSVRSQIRENGSVGLLYKIQSTTVIVISLAAASTLNYLFAQTIIDWLFQYIPTAICVAVLVVQLRVKVHNAT
jgi:hypothetical protein